MLSYAETFQRVMASHLTNLTVDCDSRVFSYRNRQIWLIRVLRIFGNLQKDVLVHTYLISKVMTLSFRVLSEGIFLLSHLYLQILERDNKFSLIHKIYRLPFPLSHLEIDLKGEGKTINFMDWRELIVPLKSLKIEMRK